MATLEYCCARCSYRSQLLTFFRREKSGGWKKTFCHFCSPHTPTRGELATYVSAGFMIAAGVFVITFVGRGGEALAGFFVFWGAVIASNVLTATVHEFGHATAAWAVGMNVTRVAIGSGPALVTTEWRNLKIVFRKFLLSGGITFTHFQKQDPEKWRYAVMLLGGIAANLILSALIISSVAAAGKLINSFIIAALYALLTSQLFVILANLWPRNIRLGDATFASDGKLLLATIRTKTFDRDASIVRFVSMGRELLSHKRYDNARRHFEEACAIFPDRPYLLSLLIHSTAKAKGPDAALQCYFDRKESLGASTETDAAGIGGVYINAAWYALLTEREEFLSLADELLEKAAEIMPDASVVQATEGARRVRKGDIDAGSELLIRVVRSIESVDDKSEVASLLAEIERSHGDAALANEMARWVRYVETTI